MRRTLDIGSDRTAWCLRYRIGEAMGDKPFTSPILVVSSVQTKHLQAATDKTLAVSAAFSRPGWLAPSNLAEGFALSASLMKHAIRSTHSSPGTSATS